MTPNEKLDAIANALGHYGCDCKDECREARIKNYFVPMKLCGYHISAAALVLVDELRAEIAKAAEDNTNISSSVADVLAERRRQIKVEGWTPEHDDLHSDRVLAKAAAVYALNAAQPPVMHFDAELQETIPENWPWSGVYWKPRGPRHDLVRAGALILAEIERIDRDFAIRTHKEGES
jgi:hypothetical protein